MDLVLAGFFTDDPFVGSSSFRDAVTAPENAVHDPA